MQSLVVLLPVVALALFGTVSLRQDLRLARLAATENAGVLADALLSRIWGQIEAAAEEKGPLFTVDARGDLASPKPLPGAEDLAPLPLGKSEGAIQFRRALDHLERRDWRAAAESLREVAENYASDPGETGLPLGPLAEYKLLQVQHESSIRLPTGSVTFESFCSNLVSAPTLLSPMLLERAELLTASPEDRLTLDKWLRFWRRDENAREMFLRCRENLDDPAKAPQVLVLSGDLFLLRVPGTAAGEIGTNVSFTVVSRSDLAARFTTAIDRQAGVPGYLSAVVRVARMPVLETDDAQTNLVAQSGKPVRVISGAPRDLLASAVKREDTIELLRVGFVLGNPDELYRREQGRAFWIRSFIVLSLLVALGGLAASWRTFREQERLNESKSNFVSSVSHELRAPIASVRLMAENLERGKVAGEARQLQYFRLISQECRRLSSLIENVLDSSRIEQGRKAYEFELCDPALIVESTMQVLQPAANEKGITLRTVGVGPDQRARPVRSARGEGSPDDRAHAARSEREPNLPVFSADGKALQQALVNLVDNALKHSPAGSEVTLGLEPADDGKSVRFWVEDQGPGIPAAEHQKIFERFYRLGSELRRETQGVGIGLSIVKHIVEAHRGRVYVRSAPGQGSRFTMEVPTHLPEGPRAADG